MKRTKKGIIVLKVFIALICVAAIAVAGLHIAGFGFLMGFKEFADPETYSLQLDRMGIFANDGNTVLPQTVVYKIIKDHFDSPLPEGKTVKKAIFLGYDGYRADALKNVMLNEDSSIMYVAKAGGLYRTFAGGVSGVNEQATSTVPGWATMLTGGWSEHHGLTKNGQEKNGAETILTYVARQGHAVSFTTSWDQHTELTYKGDIEMSASQGLPATYTDTADDDGTLQTVMSYVTKGTGDVKDELSDPDLVFFTFEYTDHAGHNIGFGNNRKYDEASVTADKTGYQIIKAIENRTTYAEEDWLIVISTDHGGTLHEHGGQTPMERETWLAVNKPIEITDELLNFAIKD